MDIYPSLQICDPLCDHFASVSDAGGVSHPSLLDTLPFEQLARHVTKSHFIMFCFCLCVLIVLDTSIGTSVTQESRGCRGIIGSQPCC